VSKYEITEEDQQRLERTFIYHESKDDQQGRYDLLRGQTGLLAKSILSNVPPSRERSLALTKLEEVVMWANAGIARNE
jgi:hypothetical protein